MFGLPTMQPIARGSGKSERALCPSCKATYRTASQKNRQGRALTEASQRMVDKFNIHRADD